MVLLIGLTMSATSISTIKENKEFTEYTLKNVLNITSYEGYRNMIHTQIYVAGLIYGPMSFFIAVMYLVTCCLLFHFLSKPDLLDKFPEFKSLKP